MALGICYAIGAGAVGVLMVLAFILSVKGKLNAGANCMLAAVIIYMVMGLSFFIMALAVL